MNLRSCIASLAFVGLASFSSSCASAAKQDDTTVEAEAPVAAVATEIAAPGAPARTGNSNTWYATTFVASRPGLRIIHYWSKGAAMRAETVIEGHPIVTIVRGEDYFSFDRLTGDGIRIQRSPIALAEEADRTRPFGNDLDELKAQGGEKVEDTIFRGRLVEVWRVTNSAGRRKLWVTRDEPQLPVRLETFVRGSSETVSLDYSNWIRGIDLPDSFFEPPLEFQLEEVGYDEYLAAMGTRSLGAVLYPDLLHGTRQR